MGSIDNPMEIDDTSDDDLVIQSPVTNSAKRKKKCMYFVNDPLDLVDIPASASPSDGRSLVKRLTLVDDIMTRPHASGSKDPTSLVARTVSSRAAGSSKKLVIISLNLLCATLIYPFCFVGLVRGLQVGTTQRCKCPNLRE